MREDGRLGFHGAIEQDLFGRVGDVVGDDAHLVGGHAPLFAVLARAKEDEVLDFFVVELALTEDGVAEEGFSGGDAETDGGFYAGIRRFAVAARAADDAANFFGGGAIGGVISAGVFLSSAVAEEGAAVGEAFLRGVFVESEALGLEERAFIPVQA